MKKRMLLLNALAVATLLAGTVSPAYAEEENAPVAETAAEAPVTEAPETEAPVTEAPVTEAPVTEAPVTEAPVTEAPETEAPVTEAPVTEAPVTETSVTETPAAEPVTEFAASEVMTEGMTETAGTEEATEKTEVPEEETQELFSRGYARVKKGVAVYREKISAEEVRSGLFTEKSVVYVLERFENDGDKDADNDWMCVVFAVDRDGLPEMVKGYVRAGDLTPFAEEETAGLILSLSADASHVLYQDNAQIPLVPAAFEEKEATEKEEQGDAEMESVYEISASWENETLGIGDTVTLTAVCEADDAVMWQSSEDGETWSDIARGQIYTYELTEENYQLSLRAVADEGTEAEEVE